MRNFKFKEKQTKKYALKNYKQSLEVAMLNMRPTVQAVGYMQLLFDIFCVFQQLPVFLKYKFCTINVDFLGA